MSITNFSYKSLVSEEKNPQYTGTFHTLTIEFANDQKFNAHIHLSKDSSKGKWDSIYWAK